MCSTFRITALVKSGVVDGILDRGIDEISDFKVQESKISTDSFGMTLIISAFRFILTRFVELVFSVFFFVLVWLLWLFNIEVGI